MGPYNNATAHHHHPAQSGLSLKDLNSRNNHRNKKYHYHHNEDQGSQREDKAILADMETTSEVSTSQRVNVFIGFVFILELLVLVFACVLEFFLRFTTVFNVRSVKFSCTDPTLSYNLSDGTYSYRDFSYSAEVPYEMVVTLCFCLPPFIMIIGEIALWAFSESKQKTILALCKQCPLTQAIRRIIRYIGTFVFGLVVTMIFTDVVKIMVGRPRPIFLYVCRPNMTKGGGAETAIFKLSFPSMHAAMTAFTAVFMSVYAHHIIRAHSVRVIRPFSALFFIMLSAMCCATRYGLYYSHWEDVAAGFLLGAIMALYIGVFSLENFREHTTSEGLYAKLRQFLAGEANDPVHREGHQGSLSYFGVPNMAYSNPAFLPDPYDQYNPTTSKPLSIPRPQMMGGSMPNLNGLGDYSESGFTGTEQRNLDFRSGGTTNSTKKDKYRRHDTFQRDLQQTLDLQFHHSSLPLPTSTGDIRRHHQRNLNNQAAPHSAFDGHM